MPFDTRAMERIEAIFSLAVSDGRRMLYEHEVYDILEALGLQAPLRVVVRDTTEVDGAILSRFGPEAILKVVSRDLAHKSKLGGVKRVRTEDPLFVRYVMDSMRKEVLSHFDEESAPRIDGFVIAELVPFTMALGNEILIGVKEDPAFGPVLTLSKGGDDAEFFARFYDPANIVLSPISLEEAKAITSSLKIRHRYEEAGHPEYPALMATVVHELSRFAARYSFVSREAVGHHLTAMDINPFVFSRDGRLVAVDGFAEFAAAAERPSPPRERKDSDLKAFFEPRGIVVAGVSSDQAKYSMARIIVQLLSDLGRNDVYCLNPKGGKALVDGKEYPLYRSLSELPTRAELLVFAAPAGRLLEFLDTVPEETKVILISGVPQEVPFERFAAAIAAHRERGLRFIGPNCMGVFYAPGDEMAGGGRAAGLDTLFIGEERLKVGFTEKSNCALLTQSGAMAITSVERTQNAPIFKAIVSFGNKADVDVPELLRYFLGLSRVDVVAIYLEGLGAGEGREFYDIVRASSKPVIVYKSGRTEAGAKAAASHTAAMSGSYEVFQAACAQAGAVLIEELQDFYNAMKVFSMLSSRPPAGNRVAAVVNAGLDATMGADLLGPLSQASFTDATTARLKRVNAHGLANVGAAFLDVTPMTDDFMFGDFVEAVLDDPGVDCAFVALVPHVENLKTQDGLCRAEEAVATRILAAAQRSPKPLVVSINAGNHYLDLVRYLEEGGLPVFPDIRSAVRALGAFVAWHTRTRRA